MRGGFRPVALPACLLWPGDRVSANPPPRQRLGPRAVYSAIPTRTPTSALIDGLELAEPVAITLVRRGSSHGRGGAGLPRRRGATTTVRVRRDRDVVEPDPGGDRRRSADHRPRRLRRRRHVGRPRSWSRALREPGAECDWLIPGRSADGYGLSAATVERLAERGTELLITVDCGISPCRRGRARARPGIEAIVTDHHQPGDELPDCPIVHPGSRRLPVRRPLRRRRGLQARRRSRSPAATGERRARPRPRRAGDGRRHGPAARREPALVRRGLAELRRARRARDAGADGGGRGRARARSTRATSASGSRRGSTRPVASIGPTPASS